MKKLKGNTVKTITKSIGIFFLALGFAGNATILRAGEEKLAADLKSRNQADDVEVIVQYKVAPTEAHHQRVASLGGKLNRRMDFIKGAHYMLPSSTLETIANDSDVAYITQNRAVKPTFDQITDGTVLSTWANSQGQTGLGVGIAVIDSRVVSLPDFYTGLTNRIVYQQSFVGGSAADQ